MILKSQKDTDDLPVYLSFLRSVRTKATCKTLLKSIPVFLQRHLRPGQEQVASKEDWPFHSHRLLPVQHRTLSEAFDGFEGTLQIKTILPR